ncbi:serine hydrolase [Catelliglobosispora koreensis]|uniref:serine hydrolase n=1 Tax=Catelliglobosispora koreensis TaxID=129052 RepID=UPI00036E25D7|nr:serine hydrolase [Catelliglobosispora koreensis]
MKRLPTGLRVAGVLLATAGLTFGCSSGSADDFSAVGPTSVGEPPNVQAGIPLPKDSVNRAVAKLDEIVNDVMKKSGLPGAAVAVVHGGKVIYAKGFGVKDVETGEKIDPDTVFQVASVSKSVSATVVASQVTKGVATWETPLAEAMPGFQLADPWVSEHVTVGDGFSHRTGLPGAAGDKLEDLGFDRQYILDRLRMHKLNPFRTSYAYANFGLTAGAEAVARKAGMPWADLAAEAIYKPLGMTSTSSWHDEFVKRTNKATLHQKIDGKYVRGLERDPDQQDPAGGVSSSVNDMAKWLRMILGDGTFEGKKIYDPKDFQPAITVQSVAMKPKEMDARASFYGFGFNVTTSLSGRTGFNHSGAFVSGAATNISVLPSADVGIVTLTNAWPTGIPETINDSFTDLVQFGRIKVDYYDLLGKALGPLTAPVGSLVGQSAPASPAPAKPLADYAGTYANAYYGPATITEQNGSLVLAMGVGKTFPLKHWDGGTFMFVLDTENAPPGSISKATFNGGQLNLEYFDEEGMGTWSK